MFDFYYNTQKKWYVELRGLEKADMQHAQGSSCNEFVKYLNGLLISESLHLGNKDAVRVDKLEPSKN